MPGNAIRKDFINFKYQAVIDWKITSSIFPLRLEVFQIFYKNGLNGQKKQHREREEMEKQNLLQFTEEKGKPGISYFSIARAPRNLVLKKGFCKTAKSLRL